MTASAQSRSSGEPYSWRSVTSLVFGTPMRRGNGAPSPAIVTYPAIISPYGDIQGGSPEGKRATVKRCQGISLAISKNCSRVLVSYFVAEQLTLLIFSGLLPDVPPGRSPFRAD
jgi:hypothetical protein